MFTKGYTNIRAMIETQYGILSQMITDIAYRYQVQLKGTELRKRLTDWREITLMEIMMSIILS